MLIYLFGGIGKNTQYINSLAEQITYLKKEIEDLKAKNELLTNHLLQRDQLMLESAEQKQKGIFRRIFNR